MSAMTPEKLRGLIAEVLKQYTGASPEEFKASMSKLAEVNLATIKEEGQQARETGAAEGVPGSWDPQDRSHPYVQRAGHLMRNDTIKVQRAGGVRSSANGQTRSEYHSGGAGFRLARLTRAYRAAQLEGESVEGILKGWGDDWMVRDLAAEKEFRTGAQAKAMGYSNLSSGGFMVPIAYMTEMVELLRARNVVRAAGARQLPLPAGNLTMNRQTADGTSTYVGELGQVNTSQGTSDQIRLLARKLMSLTAVSNELMRTSDPGVDQYVRDSVLMQTANREDLAFLRGDGAAGTPTGFRNAIASAHISASASGTTLTTMLSDVQDLMTDLALANIPMERPAFFLSPRSLISLLFARDASGDGLLLRQEIASGSLFGIPLFTTTQIPVNLGGGAESEMYLVDMSQVIIGDSLAPVVEFFDNGTYNNNAGVLTSGISTDSTVIRLKQEHDIIMLHPEAGAVKTAVDF